MSRRRPAFPRPAAPVLLALLVGVAACGPRRLAVVGPAPDPAATAAALERRTALQAPARIDFQWSYVETDMRSGGRGVARVEPPAYARLDLFLGNGETILRAALVDDGYRLPPGTEVRMLPPPGLMWGALGVFRTDAGARLLGGDRLEGGAVRLRYGYPGGVELHYQVEGEELVRVDLLEGGELRQWVALVPDPEGSRPLEARYRDQVEVRELRLERTSVRPSDPFPAAIWNPGR